MTAPTHYAPGVQVTKYPPAIKPGERGVLLPPDVVHDILRVQVTRFNTGVSQYEITLNNSYLETPADRADAGQERTASGQPFWPRFKYNDFAALAFGDRLRIDMRYWPNPPGDEPGVTQAAHCWVPMILGPITEMRFGFGAGEGATLTVSGEDDLGFLKDKNERRVSFSPRGELGLVKEVLRRARYPLDSIAPPHVAYPAFVMNDRHGLHEALSQGQAYLDYLQHLAEPIDFEVFVEFSDLADPNSPLEFHFEPWRGRTTSGAPRKVVTLYRERDLIELNPTIKVFDQYSEVRVRGRHRDPQIPEEVDERATTTMLHDELPKRPGDGDLVSGPAVRERFFPDRPNKHTVSNQSNVDPERACWRAEAIIRKKARDFLVIEGATLGLPHLRPGRHVEIRGMRPPFDGFYYVTRTVHTFGSDGFRTRFTASRPGMELPVSGRYREGDRRTNP